MEDEQQMARVLITTRRIAAGLSLLLGVYAQSVYADVDFSSFLRPDRFDSIKISPTGEFYALTAPLADRTVLVVMRRSDKKLMAKVQGPAHSAIHQYWWVNDERLVVSMAERFGMLETPVPTGELHAINADGSKDTRLTSANGADDEVNSATLGGVYQYIQLVDTLPKDDRRVLISVSPYSATPQTRAEMLDVYTGGRVVIATAPVQRAKFVADNGGQVRYALGAGDDNLRKLYYRTNATADWQLIHDEAVQRRLEWPVGFSSDDTSVYFWAEHQQGPDALVEVNLSNGARRELLRDAVVDPFNVVYDVITNEPVGVAFMRERLTHRFFKPETPAAKLHMTLQASFPDQHISITSSTRDGKLHILRVASDRNPSDYYLFDSASNGASLIFSRSEWLNPQQMAPTRLVSFASRDGLALDAYLTVPSSQPAGKLALIVIPHGGPFGSFDTPEFSAEVQILAAAGYAVLRPNFRGSGNYGSAFQRAGALQWGGRMQDDVTDATRWAIAEANIDPSRICIYGASYGAYSALMGAAKEAALYRCAVGYVGVYDLELLYGDLADTAKWTRAWAAAWVGNAEQVKKLSVTGLADHIKVPVLLAAGGQDFIAPIEHSERMEAALKRAKVPVETLYMRSEGHGFFALENQQTYYKRLLDFFHRHLDGAKAK